MRFCISLLAVTALLTLALPAKANSISLLWQGSGTPTTAAAASASITADIVLVLSSGVHTIAWMVEWDLDAADELDYVTASSGGGPGGDFTLLGQGNTAGNPGSEGAWAYSTGNGSPLPLGTYTAGTITFHVTGNVSGAGGIDAVPSFNDSGIAGAGCNGGSCNGSFSFGGASVIPEPSTLLLGLLGLAGLGLVARRH